MKPSTKQLQAYVQNPVQLIAEHLTMESDQPFGETMADFQRTFFEAVFAKHKDGRPKCRLVYDESRRGESKTADCADGSAAEKFDAEFTDIDWGVPADVSRGVRLEVSRRTPGFSAWQQDHWLYHCADAAAFHGPVDASAVGAHPDA